MEFTHRTDCEGAAIDTVCLGCEHAKEIEYLNEIDRLRSQVTALQEANRLYRLANELEN